MIDFPSQLSNINTKLSSGKAVLAVALVGKCVTEITQKAVQVRRALNRSRQRQVAQIANMPVVDNEIEKVLKFNTNFIFLTAEICHIMMTYKPKIKQFDDIPWYFVTFYYAVWFLLTGATSNFPVIKLKMVTLAQLNSFPNILDKPIHFQMFQG